MRIRSLPVVVLLSALVVLGAVPFPLHAGPVVVPTAEGQIGESPGPLDRDLGRNFSPIPGQDSTLIALGLRTVPTVPPSGELGFLTDLIHGIPDPVAVDTRTATFDGVEKLPPAASPWIAGGNTIGVFAHVEDGTSADTQAVVVSIVPSQPALPDFVVLDDIPTFPDLSLNEVGVAADDQGRVTVVYTELPPLLPTRVKAQRIDGVTGLLIGGELPITDDGHAGADVALLDPAGGRLLIPTTDFATIRGNILDTTGPQPVVLPEFPISTTPALFANFNPNVASDPATGRFIVAWENLSGLQGDPVNIRARRFDADGNPVGDDFRVNTTTANAQGQPAVAMRQGGESVVVWAGDSSVPQDFLDVFAQVYDADGNPLGGELRVNTFTTDVQDKPQVSFLPMPDDQGRPQFVVSWRDVGDFDGSSPRGTGTSYRCFSIEGLEDPDAAIFADGFETGDTTAWSDEQP